MAISKIKVGNEEHDIVDNTHTLITLSADTGTLSASDLNKLKANPQKTIINCGGYYYYAENLTSSTTWYYSCNVYYSGSKIIKRVITITTSSGAYTKTDYEYTGGSIPDDLEAETLYVTDEIVVGEDDNIVINKNGIKVDGKKLATEKYVDDAIENASGSGREITDPVIVQSTNIAQERSTLTSDKLSLTDGDGCTTEYSRNSITREVFNVEDVNNQTKLTYSLPNKSGSLATEEYVDDSFTIITLPNNNLSGTLSAEDLAKVKANPHKTVFKCGYYNYFVEFASNIRCRYTYTIVQTASVKKSVIDVVLSTGAYEIYNNILKGDDELNAGSTNPVQNKVVTQALTHKVSYDSFNNSVQRFENVLATKTSKSYVDDAVANVKQMISLTYSELKALRDSSQLIAGVFYRITDYLCTTVQEDTRAMNNKFDIIVQALSENTLSENASADYHYIGGDGNATFIDSVIESAPDGTLVVGSVTPCYFEYIDFGGMDGLTDEYRVDWTDVFIAFDYDMNDKGQSVPVIYKTDQSGVGEDADPDFSDPDYADIFYYEGNAVIDGVTYNKWRKINYDGTDENELNWDSVGKIYLYTNVIVEGGGVIVDGIKPSQANIPAWEIKYCLDNDTTRFAWALDGQTITNLNSGESNGTPLTRQPSFDNSLLDYEEPYREYSYAWGTSSDVVNGDNTSFIYSKTEIITSGDTVFNANDYELQIAEVSIGGKGVIYYMKDEHNIECPYDFKNIQFTRDQDWKHTNQDFCDSINLYTQEEWFYTFTWINSELESEDLTLRQDLQNDENLTDGTYNIKIGYFKDARNRYKLSNNVVIVTFDSEDGLFYGIYNITLSDDCGGNTFGNVRGVHFEEGCSSNILCGHCDNIYFSHNCHSNKIGYMSIDVTLGNSSNYISILGDCDSIAIGNYCSYISMGQDVGRLVVGNNCRHIKFKHIDNTIAGKIIRVKIGDLCERVNIMPDTKENDGYIQDITFESGIRGTTTSELIIDITRGASPVVYQPSVTYHTVS